MLTGQPFRIHNIRAKRSRPGLLRQHLTAVNAAAQICSANTCGVELGSQSLSFVPGPIRGGDYRFAIGTAGSCSLVLQTLLPALLQADAPSRIHLSGGTHNPLAPPFEFLAHSWLPLLQRMGAQVELQLLRHGFVPAGGGELALQITPGTLQPLHLSGPGERLGQQARALLADVPGHVAERELARVGKRLKWPTEDLKGVWLERDIGPGNILLLEVTCIMADQHRIAPPGHVELGDLAQHLADRDIQPHDTFEKALSVDRGDDRHRPAQARRVQIHVGPYHLALGVVLGVGKVIEVVIGYHHVVGVLRRRVEPGIDPVVAVPAVEIQRRHQRVGVPDRTHQRVHLRQAHDLGVVLLRQRRAVGIERRSPTIVTAGVEHPGVGQRMARLFEVIGLEPAIEQRVMRRIAIDLQQRLDGAQATIDDLPLAQRGAGQVLDRRFLQVADLRITNGLIAQQVHRNQHRLHQNQWDQRALHERSPDPLTQRVAARTRHCGSFPWAGRRMRDAIIAS
ncbi:UNVERIFIED_CONTAM: rtcA [Trichonephila clavipes]